jgi:hypothetical protein
MTPAAFIGQFIITIVLLTFGGWMGYLAGKLRGYDEGYNEGHDAGYICGKSTEWMNQHMGDE